MYLVQYDASGNVQWANGYGRYNNDYGNCIATDAIGNIYVTGSFTNTFVFFGSIILNNHTNGTSDMSLIKFNSGGQAIWATSAGGTDWEYGNKISLVGSDSLYVGGEFTSSTMTWNTSTLTNSGGNDIFIAKYDTAGNGMWITQAGGAGDDRLNGLSANHQGAYICGYNDNDTALFGQISLTNAGGKDVFTAKFSESECSTFFTVSPDVLQPHLWNVLNLTIGAAPVTYNWNWGDGSATSNGATPSHVYSTPGNYNICLSISDATGCAATFCDSSTYLYRPDGSNTLVTVNVTTPLPTNILNLKDESQVAIYPNPVSNKMIIECDQFPCTITIIDLAGNIVCEYRDLPTSGELDLSQLANGIYVFKINYDGGIIYRKIIKL